VCTNYYEVPYYFKYATGIYSDRTLPLQVPFYKMVLKSVACMVLTRKAADEIRLTIFFKSFRVKKINELVTTRKKLTNNFEGLITGGLEPVAIRGPTV
jgi:hypothetical protein